MENTAPLAAAISSAASAGTSILGLSPSSVCVGTNVAPRGEGQGREVSRCRSSGKWEVLKE
jgi:hypothetical protein